MGPSVSVVLATVDRAERLGALVASIREQLGESDELWVIDQSRGQAAEAGREAVVRHGDPRLHWEHRWQRGLPGARNQGVARSRGDVVWFVDDDVHLRPGALEAHRRAYGDPTVGGVVGRIVEKVLRPNARGLCLRVGRSGRVYTNLDVDEAGEVESLKGANMSLRRLALRQAGPFDTGWTGTALLEDADMAERVRRAGWRLRYEPQAAVDHDHAPTGGVRADSDRLREGWRFHHTARFLRRHRGRRSLPLAAGTFAAIAAAQAVRHRDPLRLPWLLGRFAAGARSTIGHG
jgi:GT2 family glycosyltransferase